MRAKYSGFTLLELLTVIGIIVVLAGLLLGIRGVFSGAGKSSTSVTLKNLQAMMTELEVLGPLKKPNTWQWTSGPVDITSTNPNNLDFWKIPFRTTPTGDAVPLPTVNVSDGSAARYDSAAVINTQIVMARMYAVKNNQDALAKLPAGGQLQLRSAAQKSGAAPAVLTTIDSHVSNADRYPLLLDSWRNPIIYVPASGLGVRNATVAADGSVPAGAVKLSGQSSGDTTKIITSPDGKGFFASAGPDGNFQTGDDNVYSFEQ